MQNSDNRLGAKEYLLGLQHLFAMFGATVLVPIITGLNTSVALVAAGIGTLLFHLCTKFKVPVFLGSSFAFMTALAAAVSTKGIPYAQGGIIVAGIVYLVFSLIALLVGSEKIKDIFPPVVTGPVIVVIGIGLADVAIKDAFNLSASAEALAAFQTVGFNSQTLLSLGIAAFTLFVVIACQMFAKGFFKLVPILIGLAAGYLLCLILNFFGLYTMDFSAVKNAAWINIPYVTKDFFTLPKFDTGIILSIAPIAIVTFMEHIGDITTNGTVVGKNFFKDPGLHRTLLGDGLATMLAGFIGGPANTTYSENTGVLATTKNYDPRVLRIAAVFAIILGFFGKFGAILQTIPGPVKGGVELMLFGMIASIGIRSLAEANLDFTHSRNLAIVALILVSGLGIYMIGGIPIFIGAVSINLSGLFVATILGVSLNLILPEGI